MGERFSRAEQLEHRIQMLLGIFSSKGVLPLEFKSAHSVGDLLTQHLDELEQEAERKGGVLQAHRSFHESVQGSYAPGGLIPSIRRSRRGI
jgi:hypothetical protein